MEFKQYILETTTLNASGLLPNESLDQYASQLSDDVDIFFGIYLMIIMISSVTLNGLILFTIYKKRRKIPPLEIYIINLAVVDICIAVLAYPFSSVSSMSHRWLFGNIGCIIDAFIVFFFSTASIGTLTVMSFMRYVLVCRFHYAQHFTNSFVLSTLVPIYSSALIWSLGPLLGWGKYGIEPHGLSCALDWKHLSESYVMCIFTFIYVIPVLLITYCYTAIIITVRNSKNRIAAHNSAMESYLTKLTAALTISFIVAWTPYAIVAFSYYLLDYDAVSIHLSVAAVLLAKSTTLSNPIVFFFSVKRFRCDVKDVLNMTNDDSGKRSNGGNSAEEISLMSRINMSRSNLDMSKCELSEKRQPPPLLSDKNNKLSGNFLEIPV